MNVQGDLGGGTPAALRDSTHCRPKGPKNGFLDLFYLFGPVTKLA